MSYMIHTMPAAGVGQNALEQEILPHRHIGHIGFHIEYNYVGLTTLTSVRLRQSCFYVIYVPMWCKMSYTLPPAGLIWNER